MAEPIPDDELRGYSKWGDGPVTDMITGEACRDPDALQRILVHVRLTARDLARELLALRAAARVFCSEFFGDDGTGAYDAAKRLRALLHEDAP